MTASPKSYVTESPWLISKQIGWEEQIYNVTLPYWMRVFAVAMARSGPNMHTPLETGELGRLLGKRQSDGSIKPVDRRDLYSYVKKAVGMKLLDETSSQRCLVLPFATTECRLPGYKTKCRYHTGEGSKPKRPIAIKQTTPPSVIRPNSSDTSPQVTRPTVGQDARRCRVESTPTPGARDIFAVVPQ